MRRAFPFSLVFFVITGVVFVLQAIPSIGIFLMFMLAMLWSVLLINAGMIGTAIEAWTGRVSRLWLILPIAFYGGYFAMVANDRIALRTLSASYEAANAKVVIPFDARRYALVFEDGADSGGWLTQNYDLPVAYSRNGGISEGNRSTRIVSSDTCALVRQNRVLRAAGVNGFGFRGNDDKLETRFCSLDMPEQPSLPAILINRQEEKTSDGPLPITRTTTTVTMPDGRRFQLLGGVASPLTWFPMPIMGCVLISSGVSSWKCLVDFWREGSSPIVSGNAYDRDAAVLANALGLKKVSAVNRKAADSPELLAMLVFVEAKARELQLAAAAKEEADREKIRLKYRGTNID